MLGLLWPKDIRTTNVSQAKYFVIIRHNLYQRQLSYRVDTANLTCHFTTFDQTMYLCSLLRRDILVARACDPLWEKAQKNARNTLHSITIGSSTLGKRAIFKLLNDGALARS